MEAKGWKRMDTKIYQDQWERLREEAIKIAIKTDGSSIDVAFVLRTILDKHFKIKR